MGYGMIKPIHTLKSKPMDKNQLIKQHLEGLIKQAILDLKTDFSFPRLIQQEIDQFDHVRWIPSPGIDIEEVKEQMKVDLFDLRADKKLHNLLNQIIDQQIDIYSEEIQGHIETQLIDNLSRIAERIPKEKSAFQLNMLFLEHDFEPEAYFCGFDDTKFKFRLLSGSEYLSYEEWEWTKELFNGVDESFDYRPFLRPCIELEERLGEEMVEKVEEVGPGGYLGEIKKLFLLNAYLAIHIYLDRNGHKLRQLGIPMKEEVFVFGNEHDCPQLNIYVL